MVTGGAQGFGAGIAAHMMNEGANVVIADLNEPERKRTGCALNEPGRKNEAAFVKTDVTHAASVENLIAKR